ncbi:SGNH/GDSL hydrolase family protein [Companilactobacillus sp.]|jgi:lysophospholipase L1-like esterase|uniref:SGNH/GDSL hydrolase family protein n=1 Tax=Companilactobacillus sp. TaxID=2767905 RepID=UPI0025BADEC9|nr:GDSL-type esterase/lipase family protein [Companilactobacillus sp.]MCH4009636.1 GDSL-type esterase/lipase family protein [Companilactobacillus sp.]MCH4052688.1 GDSL-type esterase/lipase family protein [Companilactobacillus sp.]MCH4077578.1 GDSL-type esterase/lipase family protein [Companilactobacillus sp.]MCH4126154.1 GDSL-type esterase/lipase family protein [Companilactobacillus sp.]MCI1311862.1 GDSL-type esterase/lipase family protein [Companilactobacillus sp.]
MKRIVLFGDSIMAGFHDGMVSSELTNRIRHAFPADKIINVSVAGYKTSNGVAVIKKVTKLKPDICVVGLGANDISTTDEVKPGKFAANLTYILEEIGCKKSILISPPYTDWHRNPTRPWTRQLQFELVTEHLGKELNVPYIDLLHKMAAQANVNDLLQHDGLHFSSQGYDLLEEALVPMIQDAVTKQNALVSN